MATNEDPKSSASTSHLIRSLSLTPSSKSPSVSPSMRKKIKSAKSSTSVTKSNSYSRAEKDKPQVPRMCECGPDLYSRVLGHTADEAILTGLQTVIDLCSKLRVCGDRDDSGDEEPEREQDLPERDGPSRTMKKYSQTETNVVSAGFQVKPSVTNMTTQTRPLSELLSEMLGVPPEMVSKLIQTSFERPSMTSMFVQTLDTNLKSGIIQTMEPDIKSDIIQTMEPDTKSDFIQTMGPELKSNTMQTVELPVTSEAAQTVEMTESRPIGDQAGQDDEHKCISPPEPPPTTKICKCCKCAPSKIPKPKNGDGEKPCICTDKKLPKCRCDKKKSSSSSVGGEPQPPREVRYAVARISKYKEFTTYEVMKSTKNKPKQIPGVVEGVFVLKQKSESAKDLRKGSGSKSEVNGLNGVRNGSKRDKNGGRKTAKGENGGGMRRHSNGGSVGRNHSEEESMHRRFSD